MAKRYGGQHSPTGQRPGAAPRDTVTAERLEVPSFKGRTPMRHGAKINMLFVLPVIALGATLFSFPPVTELATELAGIAALFLGAWLTRDGVRAEDAFNERKVAKRPAIPRKMFGSVATGLGVGLLIFGGQWQILPAVIIGALAGGLHLFSFGLDPMKDKGIAGADRIQTERVARKIDEAERVMDQMKDTIKRARDRQLES